VPVSPCSHLSGGRIRLPPAAGHHDCRTAKQEEGGAGNCCGDNHVATGAG